MVAEYDLIAQKNIYLRNQNWEQAVRARQAAIQIKERLIEEITQVFYDLALNYRELSFCLDSKTLIKSAFEAALAAPTSAVRCGQKVVNKGAEYLRHLEVVYECLLAQLKLCILPERAASVGKVFMGVIERIKTARKALPAVQVGSR